MKIGLVIYGSLDTLSGGYLYDRKLVDYLRAQGDAVEVISLPWRNYAVHLTDNLTFRLPPNLDLLIQDELNHPSLLAANLRPHPYPVVSLVHHLRCSELRPQWQNAFYRLVERQYLRGVDGFIFNSQTTASVVSGLIPPKPSVVAYPPTDRFGVRVTEEEVIERAVAPELRILFLGNVMFRKGLHMLIDAVQGLSVNFRVDVVGSLDVEPAYAKEMQARAASLSSFFFHGALDSQPLVEKLKYAHVLVVPSSYEGFGIVYLEGMGFGLPAIGTDLGAAGEVISNGVDGFIVRAGDSVELAARLKFLAEQRGALIRMGQAARARFLRQPAWEQSAESIRQFLKGML
jgi:glycosyltransferase involved in cell wall biosynthesis